MLEEFTQFVGGPVDGMRTLNTSVSKSTERQCFGLDKRSQGWHPFELDDAWIPAKIASYLCKPGSNRFRHQGTCLYPFQFNEK